MYVCCACLLLYLLHWRCVQVFDRELAKIDKDKVESCSRATNLKKDYRHYVKKTATFKDKLEVTLAKDPPKPQEQDR